MRAVRRALLLFAALSSILVLGTIAPVSAHTGFESSDPPDGSTVGAAVETVTIAFSGPAQPAGEGFVILEPSGTIRTPDVVAPDSEQQIWTLRFDPPLDDGVVGVRWTVQAPDAHPISGSFSFAVDGVSGSSGADAGPESEAASAPVLTPAAGLSDGSDRNRLEITSEPVAASGLPSALEEAGSSSGTQDLEAFLQHSEISVAYAAGLGTFGRLIGFVGTMVGVGSLCFAAVVVRNHRRDLRLVLKAVRYAAVAVVAGTALDLVAHLAVANNGWWEILSVDAVESVAVSAFGLAVGLRMAGGALLFAAAKVAHEQVGRIESIAPRRELVLAGDPRPVTLGSGLWEAGAASELDDWPSANRWSTRERWPDDLGELNRSVLVDDFARDFVPSEPMEDRPISVGSVVAVILLLASFTFDGHTVTEGNRFITGLVDMVHVVAASVWAGGVVAFAMVLWRRYRRRERLNGLEMALRFSVIAGAALAVAGVAGTFLAVVILDSVSELWTTPWGRLLVTKTAAVAAAASLGSYNHFVVIPWMNASPDDDARSVRIRNTATGEAILLGVVVVVTAFLVGASSQP